MSGMEDKQLLLAQFMEVVGEPAERCNQFLEATNWQLEEAIQLYFAGGGVDIVAPPAAAEPPAMSKPLNAEQTPVLPSPSGDEYVRPPLPVKREALYEDIYQYRAQRRAQAGPVQPIPVDAFRNFEDEFNSRIAKPAAGSSPMGGKAPTLASMYRPPLELNFEGSFEQAKAEAAKQGKWLLVNLQSHTEFASHMLNRDTWAHEAVKDTVRITFVFWQIYDDTEEGKKVCTYYRLNTMPTILVLDPLTGQKMRSWEGMVGAERLLEDLVQFMDRGPMENQGYAGHTQKRPRDVEQQQQPPQQQNQPDQGAVDIPDEDHELQRALAASLESQPEPSVAEAAKARGSKYPALPEEPKPEEPDTCRVGVRFPDGKRGQRRYFRSDPLTYLWSYCCLNVEEAASGRKFRLTLTIPGGKSLEYDPRVTIDQAGVANAILNMAWD